MEAFYVTEFARIILQPKCGMWGKNSSTKHFIRMRHTCVDPVFHMLMLGNWQTENACTLPCVCKQCYLQQNTEYAHTVVDE